MKKTIITNAVSLVGTDSGIVGQKVIKQQLLLRLAEELELDVYLRMEESHIIDLTVSGDPTKLAKLAYLAGINNIKIEVEEG